MLTSSDVLNASFTSTSFRRGYDELEVDEFLDELVETLRYYEQGGQPARGVPAYPAPSEADALGGPTPPEPEASEPRTRPAPSGLPVMVSATSRRYIERAQRASRWLREEPLS